MWRSEMKIIEVDKLYDVDGVHTEYVYRIVETTYTEHAAHQMIIREYITDLNGIVQRENTYGTK
jgi:hypothetical protein